MGANDASNANEVIQEIDNYEELFSDNILQRFAYITEAERFINQELYEDGYQNEGELIINEHNNFLEDSDAWSDGEYARRGGFVSYEHDDELWISDDEEIRDRNIITETNRLICITNRTYRQIYKAVNCVLFTTDDRVLAIWNDDELSNEDKVDRVNELWDNYDNESGSDIDV